MWVQKAGFYSSVSLPRGCEPPVSAIFGDHRAQQQELIRVSGLSCSVNHDGLAPCPLHQCCHSPSLTRSEETESLSLLRSYSLVLILLLTTPFSACRAGCRSWEGRPLLEQLRVELKKVPVHSSVVPSRSLSPPPFIHCAALSSSRPHCLESGGVVRGGGKLEGVNEKV